MSVLSYVTSGRASAQRHGIPHAAATRTLHTTADSGSRGSIDQESYVMYLSYLGTLP